LKTEKQSQSLQSKSVPTKRAPDAGDSAAISSSFLRLVFFWLDGVPPSAPAQVTRTVGTPLAE